MDTVSSSRGARNQPGGSTAKSAILGANAEICEIGAHTHMFAVTKCSLRMSHNARSWPAFTSAIARERPMLLTAPVTTAISRAIDTRAQHCGATTRSTAGSCLGARLLSRRRPTALAPASVGFHPPAKRPRNAVRRRCAPGGCASRHYSRWRDGCRRLSRSPLSAAPLYHSIQTIPKLKSHFLRRG